MNFSKKQIGLVCVMILSIIIITLMFVFIIYNTNLFNKSAKVTSIEVEIIQPSVEVEIDEHDNKLKNISFYEINKIEEDEFIVVITKEDCKSCKRFMVNLEIFVRKYDISVYLTKYEDLNNIDKAKYKLVPVYQFYKNGEMIFNDYGNIDATVLYDTFVQKIKEE